MLSGLDYPTSKLWWETEFFGSLGDDGNIQERDKRLEVAQEKLKCHKQAPEQTRDYELLRKESSKSL
jgi:hypothetical protein